MKIFLSILSILFLSSCGGNIELSTAEKLAVRNLTAEFASNKKSKWATKKEMVKEVQDETKEKWVIFAADWCKACNFLRKAISQIEFPHKIYWVNVDEDFGQWAFKQAGGKSIPLFFHANPKTKEVMVIEKTEKIAMYLLLNK